MPHRLIIIKSFNVLIMLALFIADSLALDLNLKLIAVAALGSVSGAFVLGYFKQNVIFWERMVKMLASGIAGLFVGAFFSRWLRLEYIEYIAMMYFVSSFLSLVFLRALLSVSETSAKDIIIRIINVWTKSGTGKEDLTIKTKKRRRRHTVKKPAEPKELVEQKVVVIEAPRDGEIKE